MNDTTQWYEETTNGASYGEVSAKTGIPKTTLYQQAPNRIKPENVVRIARAYGADPVASLAAVGLITADELTAATRQVSYTDAGNEELAREVLRRMNAGERD